MTHPTDCTAGETTGQRARRLSAGRHTRLPAIADEAHERLVLEALDAGHADRVMSLIDGYQHKGRLDQGRWIADILAEERQRFGINCPPEVAEDQILLSTLITPTVDDALALALARFDAHTVNTDDVDMRSKDGIAETLRALAGDEAAITPCARYTRYMLDQLRPFTDPTSHAMFTVFLGNAVVGALWEGEYPADADFTIDPRYVRDKVGAAELWAATLCFLDPCLDFWANTDLWARAMQPLKTLLEASNDVFSFYKEAIHGADFTTSEAYRVARRRNVPYHVAYGWAVDATERSYGQILNLGDRRQQPFLETFANGFLYWSAHSRRYRWQELYPSIKPLTLATAGTAPPNGSDRKQDRVPQ